MGFQSIYGNNSVFNGVGVYGLNGGDQGIAENWIGRLGNEANDNYAESEFVDKTTAADGSYAKYHIMFATRYQADFASYPNNVSVSQGQITNNGGSQGYSPTTQFMVRQLYAEFGGFSWDPKSVYWVGKKYVGRDDIHIIDYFWRDFSGEGFGVTNAANGLFDLSFTTNGQSYDGNTNWNGTANVIATSLLPIATGDSATGLPVDMDFRLRLGSLSSLSFLNGLELEYNVQYQQGLDSQMVTAAQGSGAKASAVDYGNQFAAVYSPDKFFWFADGYSRVVLQYGMGNAATAWNMGHDYPRDASWSNGGNPPHATSTSWALKAIAYGEANNILPNLDVMPALIYQTYYDGFSQDSQAQAIQFDIRPVYKFTQNLSLQVEYGIGDILSDNGATYWSDGGAGTSGNGATAGNTHGVMQKISIAPTLSLDSGFWGRPQLRLFYSFISMDQELFYRPSWGAAGTFANDGSQANSASLFGVQFETWF